MPRQVGAIHYALVDESARLKRIIEILKEADHPLSSQEIAIQAYDFAASGKVMLNVSTNIGEIRGTENMDAGYVVAPAKRWKSDRYPWHDGRPRYWLIAAPGWRPRWVIDGEGGLVRAGARGGRETEDGGERTEDGGRKTEDGAPKFCLNPYCGRELPEGQAEPFCPDAACREVYFRSLQVTMKW